MKKSRIFSALLVLALLSTCVIGGTFAKYVTSGTGTDTARVAKFGVAVSATGTTFATSYATDDTGYTETNSVISTDKVVAPGTKGEMGSVTISGKPEVAVMVTCKGEFALSSNWTVDGGAFYCPLVITVGSTEINGATMTSKSAFESAVNDAIAGYYKTYPAGTDFSSVTDALKISWSWPFSTSDANDIKDTWLGGQAAGGNPATVTLKVTTTVTQID